MDSYFIVREDLNPSIPGKSVKKPNTFKINRNDWHHKLYQREQNHVNRVKYKRGYQKRNSEFSLSHDLVQDQPSLDHIRETGSRSVNLSRCPFSKALGDLKIPKFRKVGTGFDKALQVILTILLIYIPLEGSQGAQLRKVNKQPSHSGFTSIILEEWFSTMLAHWNHL